MGYSTLHSIKWSLLDTYAGFVLKFVFTVMITRKLTPHDFGIVAYMGLFLGIATWLSEGGFGSALIQNQNTDQTDYSTAWIFNMGVALLFFILYFIISGFVADFFNEPALKWIMRITSINLLFNSICYIHTIKLIKAINFHSQAIVNFISSFFSGSLGLLLAYIGWGYWALILMTLSGSMFRAIGYLIVTKWYPSLVFSINSFREQFRFGSNVFIQGLLESIFKEMYSLVIGKTYNTNNLGLYSRGYKFYELFMINTGIAFNKVLYPTMSIKSTDRVYHKESYFRYYDLLFFISAPISLFLILLSKPIIIYIFTKKWLGAVIYMRLYCIAGFIFILIYFNSSTLLSMNKPRLYLKMDIIQKMLFLCALIITFKISIPAIIIGWLLAYYIYYIFYEYVMYKYGFANKMKYLNMLKVLFSLIPSIIVFILLRNIFYEMSVIFVLQTVSIPFVYIIFNRIFKLSAYQDFACIVRPSIPRSLRWIV